jgi:excisionase family DNA binding protein
VQLSLQQAAERLGKSVRQIRYLVQNGRLPAQKIGGRWMIAAADLPLSDAQRGAVARRERALRTAVDRGLGLEEPPPERYSVRNLKAFQITEPLYRQGKELLGAEHSAVVALRDVLTLLTKGCHRYAREDKASAYREARDAASLAVCELVLAQRDEAEPLIRGIEQELMAAFSGLLRRLERHPKGWAG